MHRWQKSIDVTYDKSIDAAYLSLVEIPLGGVDHTVEVEPGTIMLDFDRDDRLLGIEILGAGRRLPLGFLHSGD